MRASSIELYDRLSRELSTEGLTHSSSGDGGHDEHHLRRVWANVDFIHSREGGDLITLAAAVLLHDCVAIEKNSPLRGQASRLSAERAGQILKNAGWPPDQIKAIQHAIHAHSFSANVEPESLEAQILRDADRLDAIGLIGIARCFYTAGRLGTQLYHPTDPRGETRDLDDSTYALDHFPRKLLTLRNGFHTAAGRELAEQKQIRLQAFYDQVLEEVVL